MTQAASPFATSVASGQGAFAPPLKVIGAGRLVVFVPKSDRIPAQSQFKDQATGQYKMVNALFVDLVICDGAAIRFGGNPAEKRPDTHSTEVPTVFQGVRIMGERLIDQILATAQQGIPMGRLGQVMPKNGGNPMWELESPTPEDIQIAMRACEATNAFVLWDPSRAGQQLNTPPVVQLFVQPAAPAMPQFSGYPQMPAVPAAPAPQFQVQPAGAPPSPFSMPPMQPAAPVMPQFAAPAQPVQAPVADWTLDLAGFQSRKNFQWPGSAEQWAGMDQETRTAFLSQQGITGA